MPFLLELATCFPVFPSPSGCRSHGRKGELALKFDVIAKEMGTARPVTKYGWDPTSEPPDGMVLKREYSSCSEYVFLPKPSQTRASSNEADRERKRCQRWIRKHLDAEGAVSYKWMAQEYVPTLRTVGELRYMCIGGEPARVTITSKCKTSEHDTSYLDNIDTLILLKDMR